MKVCPAIVSVPVRAEEDPFAATLIATVPSPAPLAPPVMVSHGAWLAAVHAQPPPVSTVAEIGPPPAATDSVADDNVNVHVGPGAPAAVCDSVYICPAISTVPDRSRPVFGATSIATLPLPVPDAPMLTVIQDALLVAVQEHDGPAVTRIVRLPPVASIASLVLLSV